MGVEFRVNLSECVLCNERGVAVGHAARGPRASWDAPRAAGFLSRGRVVFDVCRCHLFSDGNSIFTYIKTRSNDND